MRGLQLLGVLGVLVLSSLGEAKRLYGGSLTWEVNPRFRTGERYVTFTLQTAMEMDLTYKVPGSDGLSCTQDLGKKVECETAADEEQFGYLCVDQYTITPGVAPESLQMLESSKCLHDQGPHTGTVNRFTVMQKHNINGVNVVMGELKHTVKANLTTTAMIAYFKTGDASGSMLLPNCAANLTFGELPCGRNIREGFGIEDLSDTSVYYSSLNSAPLVYPTDETETLGQGLTDAVGDAKLAPALETMVMLCDGRPDGTVGGLADHYRPCSALNGSGVLANYFSPVASFPPFVEVAVTPATQNYKPREDLGLDEYYQWFFGENTTYKTQQYAAPSPPMLFMSTDSDGHRMVQYDQSWRWDAGGERNGSNLRAECFKGSSMAGQHVPLRDARRDLWPFQDKTMRCHQYFDGDDIGHSKIKFDFDFGNNPWTMWNSEPRYIVTNGSDDGACLGECDVTCRQRECKSHLFGTALFRCPGVSSQEECMEPSNDACGGNNRCNGNLMFTQHMIHTADLPFIDVDNLDDMMPHISSNIDWKIGRPPHPVTPPHIPGTTVQTLFSAYSCYSGTDNQPPKFVKDLDLETRGALLTLGTDKPRRLSDPTLQFEKTGYQEIETDITCVAGEPCIFPLHARDFWTNQFGCSTIGTDEPPCFPTDQMPGDATYESSDVVVIEMAPGWYNASRIRLTPAHCLEDRSKICIRSFEGCTCTGTNPAEQHLSDRDVPTCQSAADTHDVDTGGPFPHGAVKCFYNETFPEEDAGKNQVRCFEAKDPHNDYIGIINKEFWPTIDKYYRNPLQASQPRPETHRTCKSTPLCIRITVTSHEPHFVDPTPMEANSYDDLGQLVEGQTDVPACEGYPLQLPIVAQDGDAEDLLRIYVEDKAFSQLGLMSSDLRLALLDLPASSGNLDFFANWTGDDVAFQGFPGSCSAGNSFNSYFAQKEGDNSGQLNILPGIDTNSLTTTPIARYYTVNSEYGGDLEQVALPRVDILFHLNAMEKNGVLRRHDSTCSAFDPNSVEHNNCLEKLVNMDQVICGVVYDNSRYRRKRWVGATDPNGDHLPKDMRDHSNGDMASPRHCWRIQMQSPPVFVTDSSRIATPFPDTWDLYNSDNSHLELNEDGYVERSILIGQTAQYTFIAQDPNVRDTVQIFITDDPGMPAGMSAGRTECIRREDMCAAVEGEQYVNMSNTVVSHCSKAKLTITWSPLKDQAGSVHRVCAIAKDSSTACAGMGPPLATSVGWYGERQCIDFNVLAPTLSFELDIQPMDDIESYVGCMTRFGVKVRDGSWQPSVPEDNYAISITAMEDLPPGASLTATTVVGGVHARDFTWIPAKGTEGATYKVCFVAQDALQTMPPLTTTPDGAQACWNMVVQRCRYCIRGGETLHYVMKTYAMDTNWLRLWLHNGNELDGEPAVIDNPDLIVRGEHNATNPIDEVGNSEGLPLIYVGPVYRHKKGETLDSLAVRFRTTVRTLLSVNPDIMSEEDIKDGESEICIVPCSQRRAVTST